MSKSPGSFWDLQGFQENKWFATVSISLISIIVAYIILHFAFGEDKKYEYAKLDDKQVQQINKIYFADSIIIKKNETQSVARNTTTSDSKEKPVVKPIDDTNNTTKKQPVDSPILKPSSAITAKENCKCDSANKCERVLEYLNSEFDLDTLQVNSFKKYLCSAGPLESTSFLSNLKLRVKSYFWLKGPSSYFEIIFWTLFGVLCSILFGLGVVSRKSTNNPLNPTTVFDSSEIPSQLAKLFYAPLSTLIIVFGYNYFTGQNLSDISSSKGVIVFAFIGGFYSERLIAFLDRLKDVLLPNSGKADMPETKQAAMRNVVIQLNTPQLAAGATIDISKANVQLTFTKTGEIIIAKNIDVSQPSLFIADFIKQGDYKIDSIVTGKDAAGANLVLTATQNFEMKASDMFISMKLK
jgi:hypothetical protein